jgi:hypothetical protein
VGASGTPEPLGAPAGDPSTIAAARSGRASARADRSGSGPEPRQQVGDARHVPGTAIRRPDTTRVERLSKLPRGRCAGSTAVLEAKKGRRVVPAQQLCRVISASKELRGVL